MSYTKCDLYISLYITRVHLYIIIDVQILPPSYNTAKHGFSFIVLCLSDDLVSLIAYTCH